MFDRVTLQRDAQGRPTAATITDFKTNAVRRKEDIDAAAENYRPQLELYKQVLQEITGLDESSITCELLFTVPAEVIPLDSYANSTNARPAEPSSDSHVSSTEPSAGESMELNSVESESASLVAEICDQVTSVQQAHFRLIWLAGGTPSQRSRMLEAVAKRLSCQLLPVGRRMAAGLLEVPPRLRPISTEEVFQDLLLDAGSNTICLDHLEMLFDPSLQLNAVDLVQNASRRFILIASWPGGVHNQALAFGPEDHPAHKKVSFEDLAAPIITLS